MESLGGGGDGGAGRSGGGRAYRLLILAGPSAPWQPCDAEQRYTVEHYGLESETGLLEGLQRLRDEDWDAVLLQLPAPGWNPDEVLEEIQRAAPPVPCIVQGASDGHWTEAVRLTKLGAFYWLPVHAPAAECEAILMRAFEHRLSVRPPEHAGESWLRFLVGGTAAMRRVVETIRLVGQRKSTVLITGETGTGKEMAARALHAASSRAHLPLVAVNCSALPENLLEAELFGHVRGAFTGAVQNRVGRFEQAHHGTIFLDEVAEMPLDLQAKLLRVLQEREFQRLGSSETMKVDVRVIAACNVDLPARIRQGKFREDLYYRLNVVPIVMPPLRERLRDIPLLIGHFLEKVCRQEEIAVKRIAPETLERLMRYGWPGNVRQLENAVEMAVALSGDRQTLYPGDFPLPSLAAERALDMVTPLPMASQLALPQEGLDFEEVVGSIERRLLEQALRRTSGNKKAAAELLRLKRTTLTAKLKSLQVVSAPALM